MRTFPSLEWLDPRRSFSSRLALSMALLVAISLGGLLFFVIQTVRGTLESQIGENFQAQAASLDDLVALYLVDRVGELQVLAGSESIKSSIASRNQAYKGSPSDALAEIRDLDAQWISAPDDDPLITTITNDNAQINPATHQLVDFLTSFQAHSEVFVTDRYGATVGATGRLSDYNQADEEWWIAGWSEGKGKVYISDPAFDESAGVTALLIAIPVADHDGEVIGVLRSTLDVQSLHDLISAVNFGTTGSAILVGASGELLFGPEFESADSLPPQLERELMSGTPGHVVAGGRLFAHSGAIGSGAELANADGARAAARASVAELGWMTVVGQTTDEAFASQVGIVKTGVIAGGTAVLIATVAAFLLARAITQRLVALRSAAHEIGEGQLHISLPKAGRDDVGQLTESFGRMTTRLRSVIEELRDQVRRDSLTGVLNHASIVDELRSLINRGEGAESHAIVMVDVDGLKATNDVHGHGLGDHVLTTIAEALSRDDAIVGRYGGDEFVVLLHGRDRQAAESYRSDVHGALEQAHLLDADTGAKIPVRASLGIAVYPDEADTIEELIRLSDSAMYNEKRQRVRGAGDLSYLQPLGTDRAAELVGQLVPLLTAPGNVDDKLALVSHRLSQGAGYDAVNVTMFGPELSDDTPRANNTFARAPQDLVDAWNEEQRSGGSSDPHAIRLMLQETKRPLVFDDPWNDERFTEEQRAILRSAGMKSVLVAPLIWEDEALGYLGVASKLADAFGPSDAQFLANVATQVTAIVQLATLVTELERSAGQLGTAREETVLLLAAAAEAHDQTTGRHLQNLRRISEAIALELGATEEWAHELGLAAVLHDIGKIRVPESLLRTPGALAEEQWTVMKNHTRWGEEFLAGRVGFDLASPVARSHHERWDGTGYPDGLKDEDIPEAAAIVSVADAFDAITSGRPYSPARSVVEAVREIQEGAGTQFSPRVVDALVTLYRRDELPKLREEAQPGRAA